MAICVAPPIKHVASTLFVLFLTLPSTRGIICKKDKSTDQYFHPGVIFHCKIWIQIWILLEIALVSKFLFESSIPSKIIFSPQTKWKTSVIPSTKIFRGGINSDTFQRTSFYCTERMSFDRSIRLHYYHIKRITMSNRETCVRVFVRIYLYLDINAWIG